MNIDYKMTFLFYNFIPLSYLIKQRMVLLIYVLSCTAYHKPLYYLIWLIKEQTAEIQLKNYF
jgi:hypothetical protein